MKIIKQIGKQGSRCLLRLSQQEWKEIGDKTGWVEEVDRINRFKPTDHPEIPDPSLDLDNLEATVERYGDRSFAVYVNGELLCVTAYRKGASAVKAFIEQLWRENVVLKEQVKAELQNRNRLESREDLDSLM